MKDTALVHLIVITMCLATPACTAYMNGRWVDVRLRDAQTHAELPHGTYDSWQTLWGIGVPPWVREGGGGGFRHSHVAEHVVPCVDTEFKVRVDSYGENRFVFCVPPWGKRGTTVIDWKRAEVVTPNGRAIEYQIVFPELDGEGLPK